MKQEKALFILHYSPPIHGAAKVGDTILKSSVINDAFKTRYIKIKSSNNLESIGTFRLSKIWFFLGLLFNVVYQLVFFRPKIIYFTTSPRGFAFYRDIVISIAVKIYRIFNKNCEVFYHYHAKGIYEFTKHSKKAKNLTNFFVSKVNIIFISNLMKNEVSELKGFNRIIILNNGVPNKLDDITFKNIIEQRQKNNEINVLYLSNMMKEKGYDVALKLAKSIAIKSEYKVKFNFAGAWSTLKDKSFFETYVKEHNLESVIKYHGLVSGEKKSNLFKTSNVFVFPTSYSKEVFPLSILEALSYGLPVLTFSKGAIPEIINEDVGIITNKEKINKDFNTIVECYLNEAAYNSCRNSFLINYTNKVFEKKLVTILKQKTLENC